MILRQFLNDLDRRAARLNNSVVAEAQIWSIISAMRGPDFTLPHNNGSSEELKWLTTARIRHIVFGRRKSSREHNNYDHYAPMFLGLNSIPLTIEQRDRRDKYLDNVNSHYAQHITDAYRAIRRLYDYDLWIEEEVKEEGVLDHKEV